ncbi:hypothetical protein PR048_009064 [Dryococelus australis]|uniref:Uncharacterized protein n=1 Tax=Dryococelus australis TaxID=614101 RepID=A0ABQ9HYU5_9NEOP|nr:hypothetical protein PR048_009064 [Dryococelus australis]
MRRVCGHVTHSRRGARQCHCWGQGVNTGDTRIGINQSPTFVNDLQHMRETSSVQVKRANACARRRVHTPSFEEDVLEQVADQSSISTLAITNTLGFRNWSVLTALHEPQLHPYNPQKVQVMGAADFPPWVEFWNGSLHALAKISALAGRFSSVMKLPSHGAACLTPATAPCGVIKIHMPSIDGHITIKYAAWIC